MLCLFVFQVIDPISMSRYSELDKALCSPALVGFLPKIVATFLIQERCLAEQVDSGKQHCCTTDTWEVDAVKYVCRVKCCEVGVAYEAKADQASAWSPLRYMQESSRWK